MSTALADLRRKYSLAGLRRADLSRDPIQQFESWFDEAVRAQVLEPSAMSLATAGPQGQPSARIVLLKSLDARGFVFFTNYDSRKGRELAENPRAALLVHWRELERQVSICGAASKVPREESEAYFQKRSDASQWSRLGLAAKRGRGRPPGPGPEAGRSKEEVFRRPGPLPARLGRIRHRPRHY